MPPRSLTIKARSEFNVYVDCEGGAVTNMSSGVCLVSGELGNKLLNLRRGPPTLSASTCVIMPDDSCLLRRAFKLLTKASRKWL